MADSLAIEESTSSVDTTKYEERSRDMALTIKSPAFENGKKIPIKYTCDGESVSPPLLWEGIPDSARSLVLISDDPDAPMGTWVHWVVYDIPPKITEFPENIPTVQDLANLEEQNLGGKQGMNSGGKIGYYPPCPPSGTHRYFFKLYALDAMLEIEPGATKNEILQAMHGHVIAETQLMGLYSRK
ncbi:MAG: hypothetical protein PWQ09_1379 [Candidatus Cloacimonadota bacterium]|jgi:hypothetical protein|nr:hypothetical protein [Candidatus Cloacimonadota bacterium]